MKRSAPSVPSGLMSFIALFSVANTALVNYVTASRLIYGMAGQGLLPKRLGNVHAIRKTPHIAIAALLVVLLLLVASGSIADLAAATVLLLLVVFIAVNAALVALKRTAWGGTRPFRSSVASAHCRHGRLRSAARNAAVKSRMASASARRADPVG